MCDSKKNIVINILPQGSGAWMWISIAAIVFSMASCAAREAEAKYTAVKAEASQ